MYRIDNRFAATTLPVPAPLGTQGFFTGGDPTTGQSATIVDADWLNGDLPQSDRERVMNATKEGKLRFLVATDVAARGIDISHLTPAECILLAEQLWERARTHAEAIPVTDAQMAELNRRLDAYERGELPPGRSWEEVDAWLGTL